MIRFEDNYEIFIFNMCLFVSEVGVAIRRMFEVIINRKYLEITAKKKKNH